MTLRAVHTWVRWCILLLASAAQAADEDALVADLVRQVCCAETTGVSQYDLGPLLALQGQEAAARALLETWEIPDEEFARLERDHAIWVLCALLDHKRPEVQARAAAGLAGLADRRTAPILWLHGQRHYVAYAEGTPKARTKAGLAAAMAAIGMERPPKGFDFLVRHWLRPGDEPGAAEDVRTLQRRIDAREKVEWEDVVRLIPPGGDVAVAGSWRWYPLDDRWTVACFVHYGVRQVRIDPRLPEATRYGPEPRMKPLPVPTREEDEQISSLVTELNNPRYANRTPVGFGIGGIWSGADFPRRPAAWDLLPFGEKIATTLVPRLDELDADGAYAGRFCLWRVLGERCPRLSVVTGDRRSTSWTALAAPGAEGALAWQAWLDLVQAGVPRGGLAIRLRGARALTDGDIELDYTLGWFGLGSTFLAFPELRPAAALLGTDAAGGALEARVVERYEVHPSGMPAEPNTVLLGRFLVPGGARLTKARVRLTVPPSPPPIRRVWSGTIESNEVVFPR